ncbi:MAG: class I SAM-dependent methyltransferase [Solirubrobacteraceae bacterium]
MKSQTSPSGLDWGAGRYELTASELEPVAQRVVALASLSPGECVLDIACGTGNAALLAARAGAVVSGLDGAARLVEVARDRATAQQLDATFVVGDLHELPFADHSFGVVLSVFGVTFAEDPVRAVEEIVRVLAPGGRALLTSWIPGGPVDAAIGVAIQAVAAATGGMPPRFAWHDTAAVTELVRSAGAEVEFDEAQISFYADSVEEYFATSQEHPLHVSTRPLLEGAGSYESVSERMLEAYRAGNEDPGAFRVTSRYRIAKIARR